eukprot:1158444-Pelagomonas_calceolata.AAC.4
MGIEKLNGLTCDGSDSAEATESFRVKATEVRPEKEQQAWWGKPRAKAAASQGSWFLKGVHKPGANEHELVCGHSEHGCGCARWRGDAFRCTETKCLSMPVGSACGQRALRPGSE